MKHIDTKVADHSRKRAQLKKLGKEISESARETAVAFIDLADSTAMKEAARPEDWLVTVYDFLHHCCDLVANANGVVVKRIGDEVLATFENTSDSEAFISSLTVDENLSAHKFKVSVDFGKAYFFQFIEGREDDPYGTVVDRCARISKLAQPGTVLCSHSYYESLSENKGSYIEVSTVALKGLSEPCTIYAKCLVRPEAESYLEPILAALNAFTHQNDGFKQKGRTLTSTDLSVTPGSDARPFLARELLNLPKCPYSIAALRKASKEAGRKDRFKRLFLGYIVEGTGRYSIYQRILGSLLLIVKTCDEKFELVTLQLPASCLEVVESLGSNQLLRFRGVLSSYEETYISINYVELEAIDD